MFCPDCLMAAPFGGYADGMGQCLLSLLALFSSFNKPKHLSHKLNLA